MYSLALCLDAPMQSWGTRSRGSIRDTAREPTKSGVVGLLAAALGIPRDRTSSLVKLSQLRMGIRVDREGILERDYQVTQNVPTTTGGGHRTALSHRYYLADALFLVVLESEDADRLAKIQHALRAPVWPLFLGRRAFPPARPLVASGHYDEARTGLGLTDQPLEAVLATHPWLEDRPEVCTAERRRADRDPLRTVIDCDPADPAAELRMDVPLSFKSDDRRYAARTVRFGSVPLTDELITTKDTPCTSAS
ncbi:type I-E CRISPR-associated protein Cas5/CasD [Micromonospora craterilacus]|uniref:type I-E CRISPR-associated protein Cas5/CasD n=1 Tax=Micromonospora craterilacus TaxID=1655439 RepID=UPI0022781E3E|nr:type I-E CRISPR-associated protein Cas5/CasD [Micromonospora craterilacus]